MKRAALIKGRVSSIMTEIGSARLFVQSVSFLLPLIGLAQLTVVLSELEGIPDLLPTSKAADLNKRESRPNKLI